MGPPMWVSLLGGWCLSVATLRRRRRKLRNSLDPDDPDQADRLVRLMGSLDHSLITTRALEFALFRTFGSPSISSILEKGDFPQCPGRRYDDTDLLLREATEHGMGSERAQLALKRINAIHAGWPITNEDMLFTLALFVTQPIEWIRRYELRTCTAVEKRAVVTFWRRFGAAMNIQNIPDTYEGFLAFQEDYEKRNFAYADSNRTCADATVRVLLSTMPGLVRPLAMPAVHALCDKRLREAIGYPRALFPVNFIVPMALRLRALFVGVFVPPRPDDSWAKNRTPRDLPAGMPAPALALLKPLYHQYHDKSLGCLKYKDGYRIPELGPDRVPAGRLKEAGEMKYL
ncbi:unnamed protein product [Pedinophyceae sp. YPF-701]|nr:unnamed protein product [Pedinophyceae sp. YPF-701]